MTTPAHVLARPLMARDLPRRRRGRRLRAARRGVRPRARRPARRDRAAGGRQRVLVGARPPRPNGRAPFTVLFVGRPAREKGVAELVAAWRAAALDPAEAALVLAGDGHEARSGVPGIQVAGALSPGNLRNFYAGATLWSYRRSPHAASCEPWGLVANEAMNQHCAVIATDAVGAAAGGLVRQEATGLVVPAGDSAALGAAIRRLHDDPALRARLAEAGARAVTAYTYEAWASGFASRPGGRDHRSGRAASVNSTLRQGTRLCACPMRRLLTATLLLLLLLPGRPCGRRRQPLRPAHRRLPRREGRRHLLAEDVPARARPASGRQRPVHGVPRRHQPRPPRGPRRPPQQLRQRRRRRPGRLVRRRLGRRRQHQRRREQRRLEPRQQLGGGTTTPRPRPRRPPSSRPCDKAITTGAEPGERRRPARPAGRRRSARKRPAHGSPRPSSPSSSRSRVCALAGDRRGRLAPCPRTPRRLIPAPWRGASRCRASAPARRRRSRSARSSPPSPSRARAGCSSAR